MTRMKVKKATKCSKPYATRFKKEIGELLEKYCSERGVNESDVIQAAVECFLSNKKCLAKRRIE